MSRWVKLNKEAKRLCYAAAFLLLFAAEVLIGFFGSGFVRNSLGDVLAVTAVSLAVFAAGAFALYATVFAPRQQYRDALACGNSLYLDGDPKAAAGAFARALELQPEGEEALAGLLKSYTALADAAVEQGDFDTAIYQMELCYALTDDPRAERYADELRRQQAALLQRETLLQLEQEAQRSAAESRWDEAASLYRQCFALTGDARYEALAQEQERSKQQAQEAEAARSVLTASLPGGTYTGSQVVSLSCPDPSARIYYTLDGTAPSQGSLRYDGGVELGPEPGIYVLQAVAYRRNVRGPVLLLRYEILAAEEELS